MKQINLRKKITITCLTMMSFLTMTSSVDAQKSHPKKVKNQHQSTNQPFHKGSNTLGIGLGAGVDYNY